jgi:GT2 family glycosyltransferase
MQPKVYVNIVTWNGIKYLPEAINSLARQTLPDFKVTIIDNGSIDGTVDFIKNNYPHFQMLRNVRNLGFAKAHNQGIEFVRNVFYKSSPTSECFILLMNQDIILEPNCLEILVKTLEEKKDVAVVGPKLLRAFWDLETLEKTSEVIRSKIIDSAGLAIRKSRRVVDRGAGEFDNEKYDKAGYVFGISGALPMFRLKALEDAKIFPCSSVIPRFNRGVQKRSDSDCPLTLGNDMIGGEYFDEDFFSYKEDVDLCWRLQNLGWKAYYQPNAVAYHFRGAKGSAKFSIFNIIRGRKRKSPLINFWSTRNHLLTIVKNDSLKNFLRDSWLIIPYEFVKFLYILFFETGNLRAYASLLSLLPKIIRKREAFHRRTTPNHTAEQH